MIQIHVSNYVNVTNSMILQFQTHYQNFKATRGDALDYKKLTEYIIGFRQLCRTLAKFNKKHSVSLSIMASISALLSVVGGYALIVSFAIDVLEFHGTVNFAMDVLEFHGAQMLMTVAVLVYVFLTCVWLNDQIHKCVDVLNDQDHLWISDDSKVRAKVAHFTAMTKWGPLGVMLYNTFVIDRAMIFTVTQCMVSVKFSAAVGNLDLHDAPVGLAINNRSAGCWCNNYSVANPQWNANLNRLLAFIPL